MNDENKSSDKEKTVIFNQSTGGNSSNEDSTRIENPSPTTNSSEKSDGSANSAKDILDKANNNKSGINPGVFAAGVAGAGIAGTAAGAVFSEDLNDVFTPDVTDSSTGNASEVSQASIFGNTDFSTENASENASADSITPTAVTNEEAVDDNSIQMKFSDSEGTYEVTLHDDNGDHQVDSMTVDAQLVDGTNVSYTASGTLLEDTLQNENIELAHSDDYLNHVNDGSFDQFTPVSLGSTDYEIQYGDTLSELAQANQTTVAHIMELNPHLDNPNVIFAGDHIVIPTEDHATNPYQGWNPEWSEHSVDPIQVVQESHDVSQDGFSDSVHSDMNIDEVDSGQIYEHQGGLEGTEEEVYGEQTDDSSFSNDGVDDTGDYENVDWQSVEDQSVDDYAGNFTNEDFDNYESPESYYEASNDLDSMSFF
jgi:LysM repeat protein